jgi:glucose uptake protein GlcU
MPFTALMFAILGAVVLGLACYIPHKERFSSDHTVGTMMIGALFSAGIFGMAVYCLTRP